MITRENFNEVFNSITYDEIENTLHDSPQYISVELMIANTGSWVYINGYDQYNEETEEEITSNGNIYCDTDNFLMLLSEASHIYTKDEVEKEIETTYEELRQSLIRYIKSRVKHTHNEQDIKDLEAMMPEELSDILNEIRESDK